MEVIVIKVTIELDEIACFSPFSAQSSLAENRSVRSMYIRAGTRRGNHKDDSEKPARGGGISRSHSVREAWGLNYFKEVEAGSDAKCCNKVK